MSRICTIALGLFYTVAASLFVWLSWELHQLQQPLVVPLVGSAFVATLALYAWSELIAIYRIGRPRFRTTITLPVSMLFFCLAVVVIWPHRRVIAPTVILDDIRVLPPETQPTTPTK